MTDQVPLAVTTQGFSWTAAGAWATFLALLGVIMRQVGPWRRQTTEAELQLRTELTRRVELLENARDGERVRHEAERSLDRHKINNLQQCLDAVLMILEAAPDKTAEVVARVRAMRATQLIAEAEEKAAIHAAEIVAAGQG